MLAIAKNKRVLIVGYGSVAQGLTPLLLRELGLCARQVSVIAADDQGRDIARRYGIAHDIMPIIPANLATVLASRLHSGDWLLNLSVDVSSLALIEWCQAHGVFYIDTCIEPWAGGYDPEIVGDVRETTNYVLRHKALSLHRPDATTAVVAHGANPGLVSHFIKAGLLELARDRGLPAGLGWGEMAMRLGIRSVHIAERDTQYAEVAHSAGDFVNTWSVDGFISEAFQRAELGWGSHERRNGVAIHSFDFGDRSAVYLERNGVDTRVWSWVPSVGEQAAYLITHHEAISIASLLTVHGLSRDKLCYRPTVHYAYVPCPAACESLRHWRANGFAEPERKIILRDELRGGVDQLGVLFLFDGGCYWYGSTLDIDEARRLAPYNSATTLQVVAGVLGAMSWVSANPAAGVVEAESMDHEHVLRVASPYLGEVAGYASDWAPAGSGDLCFSSLLISERMRSLNAA